MREIKFRAWDAEEKEWLCIKHLGIMNNGIWYVQAIDENENDIDPPYFEDDKNLKLMQFTGLADKNGVEIYEGDIVHAYTEETDGWVSAELTGVIEYLDNSYCIKSFDSGIYNSLWINAETFEVIGNIYENPELI